MVRNPLAMQETQVWSLGREDPLQKGMATHSSILAWRIPWTEELGGIQPRGSQRIGYNWVTNLHLHFFLFPMYLYPVFNSYHMQYIYICVCVCVYTHAIYIYIYIYICTYTHIFCSFIWHKATSWKQLANSCKANNYISKKLSK